MALRICFSITLLFSLLFAPFWVSIILALVGMLFFPTYWESLVLFFISDLLYGTRELKFYNFIFVSSAVAGISLIALEFLKKKIRFYDR